MEVSTRRAYDRHWYATRTPAQKSHKVKLQRARRTALRRKLDEYKSQNACSCGEGDIRCLEFHHSTGDKDLEVANAIKAGWSWDRVLAEIQKCDLLCANCHRKLHYKPAAG